MIIIVLVAIAVVAGLLHWWSARPGASAGDGPPPLFFSLDPSPPLTHVTGNGNGKANATANGNGNGNQNGAPAPHATASGNGNGNGAMRYTPATANGNGNGNGAARHANGNGNGAPRPADRPIVRSAPIEPAVLNYRRPFPPLADEHDNAETIRFVRPSDPDAAVQLLPGRLEVLEGATPHREIRFMRIPGEPAHVILGRELGLTPHYVGLGSPTVSRQHARFDFADNRWLVKNLSRTNPLIVNDDELFDADVARPLVDGDRLELGDVVLRFHAH